MNMTQYVAFMLNIKNKFGIQHIFHHHKILFFAIKKNYVLGNQKANITEHKPMPRVSSDIFLLLS